LTTTTEVGDAHVGITASESDEESLQLLYHLDYGSESLIPSSTSMVVLTPNEFLNHVAPARTFLSEHDATELQRRGIAAHVTYRDLLVFGSQGLIDNSLHFPDECSRHKLLDLIGDLALCGVRVLGTIHARRSGHNLNGRLAELLMAKHASMQSHWSRAA
jgi:UDP-3-O-acyl-N-acetylglucosamine deacetylase